MVCLSFIVVIRQKLLTMAISWKSTKTQKPFVVNCIGHLILKLFSHGLRLLCRSDLSLFFVILVYMNNSL